MLESEEGYSLTEIILSSLVASLIACVFILALVGIIWKVRSSLKKGSGKRDSLTSSALPIVVSDLETDKKSGNRDAKTNIFESQVPVQEKKHENAVQVTL